MENDNALQNSDGQVLEEVAGALLSQATGGGFGHVVGTSALIGAGGGSLIGGVLGHNTPGVGTGWGVALGAALGAASSGALAGAGVLAKQTYDNNRRVIQTVGTEMVRR